MFRLETILESTYSWHTVAIQCTLAIMINAPNILPPLILQSLENVPFVKSDKQSGNCH